ncbi:MAG: hypothetical protein JNK92_10985 [Dechloromonas sp.]|nr:hypothetical protein [Dechloromonas sp.]
MKNSPILKYALGLLVLSGTSLPLASIAGVWDYDNAKSVEQSAAEAAPPRSGLEGPIRTETMESLPSQDAGAIYERGQIKQSFAEASPGKPGAEVPLGRATAEFPYP